MLSVLPAVLLALLAGCGVEDPPAPIAIPDIPKAPLVARPNVVIFLPDALCADHLGCYGYDVPTSPAIDALAETGYLFSKCYVQSPWTKPSVASMLTGYMPSVHQAAVATLDADDKTARVQVLREQFVTLAERFKEAGYNTALFMMNAHCQREYGFAQGFDYYHHEHFIDPRLQMNKVLEWFDTEAAGEPFFLYIHLRDPHGPYRPPKRFYDALYADGDLPPEKDIEIVEQYSSVYEAWVHDRQAYNGLRLDELSEEGLAYLRRRYDGEILYVDRQLKRLLDKLAELGVDERTTIVFVSDHGEEFREHGAIGHGRTLYDEVLHVPLIIRPAAMSQGARIPWVVRMFDLYPTLLTLCGLDQTEGIQGASFFLPDGRLALREDRPAFSELDMMKPAVAQWGTSVIDGPYKMIQGPGQGRSTAFNLQRDPAELRPNTHVSRSKRVFLADCIRKQIEENRKLAEKLGPPEWNRYDEETQEKLEAAGYL